MPCVLLPVLAGFCRAGGDIPIYFEATGKQESAMEAQEEEGPLFQAHGAETHHEHDCFTMDDGQQFDWSAHSTDVPFLEPCVVCLQSSADVCFHGYNCDL